MRLQQTSDVKRVIAYVVVRMTLQLFNVYFFQIIIGSRRAIGSVCAFCLSACPEHTFDLNDFYKDILDDGSS